MAGGSQILIDDQGITISTGGKIVYQAGQHKFEGGRRVKAEIPPLPIVNEIKTFKLSLKSKHVFFSELV